MDLNQSYASNPNGATSFAETQLNNSRESWKLQTDALKRKINGLLNEKSFIHEQLKLQSQKLYGTPYIHKPNIWKQVAWFCSLLIVALAEWPLNSKGFEYFDMNQTLTLVIAASFGFVLMAMAHFSGYFFKRFKAERGASNFWLGFLLLFFAIAAMYQIAEWRFEYLTEMGKTNVTSALKQCFFSTFIFSVGWVGSYLHTSSVKNLNAEESFNQLKKRYYKFDDEIKELQDQQSELDKTLANDKDNINAVLEVTRFESPNPSSNGVSKETTTDQKFTDPMSFRGNANAFNSQLALVKQNISDHSFTADKGNQAMKVTDSFALLNTLMDKMSTSYWSMNESDKDAYNDQMNAMKNDFLTIKTTINNEILA